MGIYDSGRYRYLAIYHFDLIETGSMKQFDLRSQQRAAFLLLTLAMIVYAVVISHEAILRYDTFQATAFDLGNMDQVLWNTIHGRLFQFTNQAIDWYGPPTRLAIHFEPIILPLSLLYVFHADPRILLVFQTLVLVSGALPVFLLARKYLPEWPLLAALMAIAYLISPALLGLNMFDFHPVALATPLLLYAMLALTYQRYVWFLIACVLAASCKEDIPLAIALLGILLIWRYKLPRLGLTLLLGGSLWAFVAFKVVIPHFYTGIDANNYWYRYETLGSTPLVAIENIILHPWLLFSNFITLDRLWYLAGLLRSTGFLALLAPEWLLPALPSLAVNLLSTDPLLYSGVYHYNAAIIPFVMVASIHGIRRLILLWQKWREESREAVGTSDPSSGAESDGVTGASHRKRRPALHYFSRYNITGNVEATFEVDARKSHGRLRNSSREIGQVSLSDSWREAMALPLFVIAHLFSEVTRSLVTLFKQLITKLQEPLYRLTFPTWRNVQWQRFNTRMIPLAKKISVSRLQWVIFAWITVMFGFNILMAAPQLNPFWPPQQTDTRDQQILQLLARIPPDASVSAGSNLNPHLSERRLLAVFPSICLDSSCNSTVQYIIVDLNGITIENRAEVTNDLNRLIDSHQFRLLARAEGVVLLVRVANKG